jgi:hypothetical protein
MMMSVVLSLLPARLLLADAEVYVVEYFAILFGLALGTLVICVLLFKWATKPGPARSGLRGAVILILLVAFSFLLIGWLRGPSFFRAWR